MWRRAALWGALILALPALAQGWVVTAKIGSGMGMVQGGAGSTGFGAYTTSKTISKSGAASVTGYFKTSAATQTLSVASATGYALSQVVLDGSNVTSQSTSGQYLVPSGTPARNHTFVVYYTPVTATLSVTQAPGGAVAARCLTSGGIPYGPYSLSGFTGLRIGSKVRVYASPNSDHALTSILNQSDPAKSVAVNALQGVGGSTDVTIDYGTNRVSAAFSLVSQVTARLIASRLVATAGDTITLDASTTTANGSVSYTFAVSPDAPLTQNGTSSATVNFANPGTYLATVTATTGSASSSASRTIRVISVRDAANGVCLACHTNRNQDSMTAYNNGTHGGVTNSDALTCLNCHNPNGTLPHPFALSTSAAKVQVGDPALAPANGYVGSSSCRGCHVETFGAWSQTLHNKPLKQLSETGPEALMNRSRTMNGASDDFVKGLDFNRYETLVDNSGASYPNPFNGRKPNAPVLSFDPDTGKRYVAIGSVGYEIVRAQGGNGKWKQLYQTKIGSAYYVLNVQWDEMTGRYEEYQGNNWYGAPGSDPDPTVWAADDRPIFSSYSGPLESQVARKMMAAYGQGHQGGPSNSSFDNRCAFCHQTGLTARFSGSSSAGEVQTGYVELNVGCEACHGPGAAHVAAPQAGNILQPQKALAATGNYFKAAETCGQCHARTEGAGQLGHDPANLVNQPTEAPSAANAADPTRIAFYGVYSSSRLNDFVRVYDPAVFGTVTLDDAFRYDGRNFPRFTASSRNHQTFEEMEQGKHGAIYQSQGGNGQGLSCWSCHDPHAANSGNIRTKVNGVATRKDDNSLCLACHNGGSANVATSDADFALLPKGAIGTAAAELAAVNTHLSAKLNHTITAGEYLQPVAKDGTPFGPFGRNTVRAGQCIACHMPLVARSAATFTPTAGDIGKEVGDIHSHTMRTIRFADLTGAHRNGGSAAISSDTVVEGIRNRATSCSACHLASDPPPGAGSGNWW